MDAFSYLSVLLSIILGLGITQVLTAAGRLIRGRAAVVPDWIPLLWAGVLLVIYVQVWWAMFELRGRAEWNFLGFLILLIQTVTLYMGAALILPEQVRDPPPGADESSPWVGADLRAHYQRHAPWFFGFMVAAVLASVLKEVVLNNELPQGANLAFHGLLLLTSAGGILTRRRWYHAANGLLTAAVVVLYIVGLFWELR